MGAIVKANPRKVAKPRRRRKARRRRNPGRVGSFFAAAGISAGGAVLGHIASSLAGARPEHVSFWSGAGAILGAGAGAALLA